VAVAVSETLRTVIDAGRSSKRLDELSTARVIGKIALQAHAAQQKAGSGKSIGPITPAHITLKPSGEATLEATVTGSSLGYSAPEQLSGGTGDRRSDVFSLGTVLWEALTHTRLFDAMNDAAVKAAIAERDITAPSDINANIPAELSAICMRALSRNPADRYSSLKSMAVEIEEFLEEAGYTDDDSRIAQFITSMHLPAVVKPSPMAPPAEPPPTTMPMPMIAVAPAAAAQSSVAPPPAAAPSTAAPVTQPPPVTSPVGTKPPPMGQPPSSTQPPATAKAASSTQPPATAKAASSTQPPATTKPASSTQPPATAKAASSTQPPAMSATAFSKPSATTPPTNAASSTTPPTNATTSPTTPPSILTDPPSEPTRAKRASGIDVANALASAGSAATALGVPAAPAPADWQDSKNAPSHAPMPTALTPMPPVLPGAADASTAVGKETIAASVPPQVKVATTIDAKHVDPRQTLIGTPVDPKAAAEKPSTTPPETKAATTPPDTKAATTPATKPSDAPLEAKPAEAKAAPPHDDTRTTLVDEKPPAAAVAAAASAVVPAAASRARAGSQSEASGKPVNPVDAVSLPGRESKADLLSGWGWGTGKHDALAPEGYHDDDDVYEQPNNRKPLMYAIGGGLGIALLVTIIALAAGGSKNKKKPQNAKSASSETTPPSMAPAHVETPAPVENAGSGSAALDPAAEKAAADKAAADQAAADKAAADQAAADKVAAEKAEADKAALAKQEAAKTEAEKKELAKQEKLAKEEAAKADAEKKRLAREEAAKADAEKKRLAKEEAAKRPKTDTKTVAKKTEPRKAEKTVAKADTTKVDVETAYRIGLQQFARGDTNGALASLRTSLAGNPSYAPTWRGLGLVFEKMGEKDQAKSAYKRYLQLAPGASDADIIRGRLERLGS
jgi:serine/threonine protein kinase